jgi:zinc protease
VELNLNSAEQVGLEMSEWMGMGDWRLLFINRDRLRKTTVEEVQRAAATYLKQTNRTLGIFIPTDKPDRSEIPALPDVLAMVKDYKGDAVMAAGEAFDPAPANIEKRTVRTAAGGVKLALLPKKTRGETVVVSLALHFGDEQSLKNRTKAGELAAQMLMRGSAKRTRQQIKDELDRLKARGEINGNATGATATFETVRTNLPAVLRLVGEILREPAFPASEFEQLREEALAGIEQQKSEPSTVAITAIQRHLRPYPAGHVNYVSTPQEDIAAIKSTTLDEVKKFYADFYGAGRGELSVVGDFDDKEVAKLAGEIFADWKSKSPYARVGVTYRDVAAVNNSLETPDKANAFFVAGLNIPIRDDNPDYPALVMGNYLLGGGFLNSRLAVRIRQKEGLSYGVGSQFQASSIDQNGTFFAFAIYAPQNATKLEAAFKEEIARMLKDGFTAEELKDAKSGWMQSRQLSRAQDNELVERLRNYLFLDRTVTWDADLEKKVEALTPEQLVAAMRKYIDPAKISIVKAGDFVKK